MADDDFYNRAGPSRALIDIDRLESQSRAFFGRVRQGYREIARLEPRRVNVVSAEGSIDHTFEAVRKLVFAALKHR